MIGCYQRGICRAVGGRSMDNQHKHLELVQGEHQSPFDKFGFAQRVNGGICRAVRSKDIEFSPERVLGDDMASHVLCLNTFGLHKLDI